MKFVFERNLDKKMKKQLIRKSLIVLIVAIVLTATSICGLVYIFTFRALMDDISQRTEGIREYILNSLTISDILLATDNSKENEAQREYINEKLQHLQGTINLKQLYIAMIDNYGILQTSLNPDNGDILPTGQLLEDLLLSIEKETQISGSAIYQTEHGSIYSVFMPVLNTDYEVIGVICMEFSVDSLYESFTQIFTYSIGLSLSLVFLLSVFAYISMNKSTEGVYKVLAHTDILTGYGNRIAFERKMKECEDFIKAGKSVAVMAFDLNNLKIINDCFGHKQGDEMIINTANIIVEHLGKSDNFYRIGGDEFAAIFSGEREKIITQKYNNFKDEKREVTDIIPSLRENWQKNVNLKRSSRNIEINNYVFSCAIGLAFYDNRVDEIIEDTFIRADQLMYEHKREMKDVSIANLNKRAKLVTTEEGLII